VPDGEIVGEFFVCFLLEKKMVLIERVLNLCKIFYNFMGCVQGRQ
jgi:hypothetical protein